MYLIIVIKPILTNPYEEEKNNFLDRKNDRIRADFRAV